MKIITHYVYPPIPMRCFDWSATLDSYEGGDPVGFGATEEAARQDLLSQLEDRHAPRGAAERACAGG